MDSRGDRDDTQGKPYGNEHGRSVPMPSGATGGYKETKFHWVGAEVGVAHIVPFESQRQHNFERGKGQCFHHVSEGEKEGDCSNAINPESDRYLR
jgi:hypothetical protein